MILFYPHSLDLIHFYPCLKSMLLHTARENRLTPFTLKCCAIDFLIHCKDQNIHYSLVDKINFIGHSRSYR